MVRPGATAPGIATTEDPTPAEAAQAASQAASQGASHPPEAPTERSPRATTREAPRTRSAASRSKSTNTRKRAAEPDSPKAAATKPTTRSTKKAMHERDDPMDPRPDEAPGVPEPGQGVVYEKPSQRQRRSSSRRNQILVSDLTPAQLAATKSVRREQSAADESSEDELSQGFAGPEPKDIHMTTGGLDDSSWAPGSSPSPQTPARNNSH